MARMGFANSVRQNTLHPKPGSTHHPSRGLKTPISSTIHEKVLLCNTTLEQVSSEAIFQGIPGGRGEKGYRSVKSSLVLLQASRGCCIGKQVLIRQTNLLLMTLEPILLALIHGPSAHIHLPPSSQAFACGLKCNVQAEFIVNASPGHTYKSSACTKYHDTTPPAMSQPDVN